MTAEESVTKKGTVCRSPSQCVNALRKICTRLPWVDSSNKYFAMHTHTLTVTTEQREAISYKNLDLEGTGMFCVSLVLPPQMRHRTLGGPDGTPHLYWNNNQVCPACRRMNQKSLQEGLPWKRKLTPAYHSDIFSYVHPECLQTTDDPEALYLLAGMFVSQDYGERGRCESALSPTMPFIPTPTPPPILSTLCGHFIVCKQGSGLYSFRLVYLHIKVFCT